MLHSLLVCEPDGTLRLAHYFLETSPEEQVAFELAAARSTAHLWAASGAATIPADIDDRLSTIVATFDGLVHVVSGARDGGATEASLADDAERLACIVKDVCNGNPVAKLSNPDFCGKAVVALEQAACGGVLAYPGADNTLRMAKLKGPKTA
ncbi:hypothetical protein FNF27_02124 [Cafeteria roenbergensis]|uniref:Coatomer subunit zeta n=1 Tax=Cafeteria roenbergensis TaxID=33653 RepID=A0A5A8E2J7_CAFRO|nr:hypothetical protein FNF29_01774 [Cafeteria roenbergensis]KAA0166557.1 hypothetical protein FNF31_01335 [Cafeteria roenbergensis]KAA0170280.1 hypothetical protein FNF28_01508 [Cafeteria roenbergensis]KAA0176428.1 hypothetical protein FNF27_02124 [Cafeteria roenbergensis]|eukprot:KAA0155399.1 hypothetical protein FNF29_01774 [Cafeteria roenbergensis]